MQMSLSALLYDDPDTQAPLILIPSYLLVPWDPLLSH